MQYSIPATCPNDLGIVDYELLITVQRSFNQSFLFLPATGTTKKLADDILRWSLPSVTILSSKKENRLSSAHPYFFLSFLVHETWGYCWHYHDAVPQMHCRTEITVCNGSKA